MASTVAVVGLMFAGPAALAQTVGDPYTTPPSGTEVTTPLDVGGTELVRTPARAATQVGGTSQSLPVTGGDVAGLIAIGLGLIAVGAVLRRNRPLTRR